MIYLKMRGRIGNQLFMLATAYMIRELKGGKDEIVVEDYENIELNYLNSLKYYPTEGVTYVSDLDLYNSKRFFWQRNAYRFITHFERGKSYRGIYNLDKRMQFFMNFFGLFHIQDGYVKYPKHFRKDVLLDGFFQSEDFFKEISGQVRENFALKEEVLASNYPGLDKIRNRNTVCISIKVQHNVGNPMYDVCSMEYWEKAIAKMTEMVENPLFFICSDNVNYVAENLIDTSKYDIVLQDSNYPVHISLGVMAQCKHFIIGNTTFGWWAQYLSENEDKVVIAPSRWYGTDVPCDIYQDGWTLIEV